MFKAVSFDVDNCWAAATEVGEPLFAPAFDASRRANHGTVSEEALCEACAECWRHPLDWVATQDGFSETMVAAGWTVLAARRHRYMAMAILAELPVRRFRVTSGFRRLQGLACPGQAALRRGGAS
jgi:putative hydrolase of the HAD superfamily